MEYRVNKTHVITPDNLPSHIGGLKGNLKDIVSDFPFYKEDKGGLVLKKSADKKPFILNNGQVVDLPDDYEADPKLLTPTEVEAEAEEEEDGS